MSGNFFALEEPAPNTPKRPKRNPDPVPVGKNYRQQAKQMLNAPGNFCRLLRSGRNTLENKTENAGEVSFAGVIRTVEYAETGRPHCLYC